MRLSREPPIASALMRTAGRVCVGLGLLVMLLVFVDGAFALLGAGIALTGGALWLDAQHRSRRPVRVVQVDVDGITLLPEGVRHTHATLGSLSIVEWSYEIIGAMEMPVTVHRAAVQADARALKLFVDDNRAACVDWLTRFEAALDGSAPAAAPLTPLDAALEQPSAPAQAGVAGVMLLAIAAVAWAWLDGSSWVVGAGAGTLAMAGCAAAMLLEWRGIARGFGLFLAAGLWAKPFLAPAMVMLPEGLYARGPFAEVHLGCLAGGLIALIAAFAASRTPTGPIEMATGK